MNYINHFYGVIMLWFAGAIPAVIAFLLACPAFFANINPIRKLSLTIGFIVFALMGVTLPALFLFGELTSNVPLAKIFLWAQHVETIIGLLIIIINMRHLQSYWKSISGQFHSLLKSSSFEKSPSEKRLSRTVDNWLTGGLIFVWILLAFRGTWVVYLASKNL
jgi:hypothetical protein